MDETQIANALKASVANIREQFAGFSLEDLAALKAAEEKAEAPRTTLVAAIDAEVAERAAAEQDQPEPAPRTATDIKAELAALEEGVICMATATRIRKLRDVLDGLKK